jgi:hypothetical protein
MQKRVFGLVAADELAQGHEYSYLTVLIPRAQRQASSIFSPLPSEPDLSPDPSPHPSPLRKRRGKG